MTDGFFLSRVLQPVSPVEGESGYFSAPTDALDPHLFVNGTDHIRPEIRDWVLKTLYGFWNTRYKGAEEWSTVWIAGSGISYQWAAARGNGDLDILIGVDFPAFFRDNQKYLGFSEQDVAEIFNQEFHAHLWPQTATTEFSSTVTGDLKKAYEVTFYVNPRSTDIRDIRPYAAYNLSDDSWTVRPPSGAAFTHPREFYDHAEAERQHANVVVGQYNRLVGVLHGQNPETPGWTNTKHQIDLVASQAQTMYDDIHLGRKNAFGPGGSGYGDFYNFRWQYHKQHGTVQNLQQIGKLHQEVQLEMYRRVYGGPIDAADVALRRAALWRVDR